VDDLLEILGGLLDFLLGHLAGCFLDDAVEVVQQFINRRLTLCSG